MWEQRDRTVKGRKPKVAYPPPRGKDPSEPYQTSERPHSGKGGRHKNVHLMPTGIEQPGSSKRKNNGALVVFGRNNITEASTSPAPTVKKREESQSFRERDFLKKPWGPRELSQESRRGGKVTDTGSA